MSRSVDRLCRTAAVVRAGWGVFLLGAPAAVLAGFGHSGTGPEEVVRVLGARHVAQAVLTATLPRSRVVPAGTAADALHAVTAAALAVASPRWRRAAAADAALAAVWMTVGWVTDPRRRTAASARRAR